MFVGPGNHFPPLSLRCSSLHRDFDVFYGHVLLLEYPLDVVFGSGRELGVVLGTRNPDVAVHLVPVLLGCQGATGGGGSRLLCRGFGKLPHGARGDGGLSSRLVLYERFPRDLPPEGELPQEEIPGHEHQEEPDDGEHDPGLGGIEVEVGREVAQGGDRAPVAGDRVYLVRRYNAEGNQEQKDRHGDQEQGYDYHDQAIETVHFTLVSVWRGSDSRMSTLRLLTGMPVWPMRSCTRFFTPDRTLRASSPGRTLALISTLAPGLLWALTFTSD